MSEHLDGVLVVILARSQLCNNSWLILCVWHLVPCVLCALFLHPDTLLDLMGLWRAATK